MWVTLAEPCTFIIPRKLSRIRLTTCLMQMEMSSMLIPLPVYALNRDQFTPGECARLLLGEKCEAGRHCLPAVLLMPPSSAWLPLPLRTQAFPSPPPLCVSPFLSLSPSFPHTYPTHARTCVCTHTYVCIPHHLLASHGVPLWLSHRMTPSALKLSPVSHSLPLHHTSSSMFLSLGPC